MKKKTIIESVVTTVLFGLLVYSAYSLWYVFYGVESDWDVHLYTVLSGVALGWFFLLFVKTIFKNAGKVVKIISFLLGNALFQGVIWGINAKINPTCTDNDPVVIKTFTVTFILSAVILLVTFILRAKKNYRVVNIILSIIYFVVSCGGFYFFNQENIKALSYKRNLKFDTITAEEIKITDAEKEVCSKWFKENLFPENGKYPFTFKVDGKEFNPDEWDKNLTESPEFGTVYPGGQTEYIVLKNKDKTLEVKVEATVFTENATCQWTVYIKNTGKENSGVISDFYAVNYGFSTGDADLYYSMGSDTAASDFSLIKKSLSSFQRTFSGTDGKPTEKFLPYFNIYGEDMSMVVGVGWTGQWIADFAEKKGETEIKVKQEHLQAYLLPDEEIRSPLISISFYENDNPLKGFNMFRKWVMDCVYPESITQNHYIQMEVAGPASIKTADEIIEVLNGFDSSVFEKTDNFWMDAGWYEYNEGWYDGVGNWTPDKKRYDNGISEIADYAKDKDLGLVLWYEPERVIPGTHFYNVGMENKGWLIDIGEDNKMWNLANDDALKFYSEYIANSLKENGATIYRQDFNFPPLEYWLSADTEYYNGRTGICENHYVTNLYKFLDYLCESIPGLIIDNCASGGKRLDLEMTYRSIPFWRSDYNCAFHSDLFDATQAHTYGISFWLPITGTALYMQNEYSGRSAIMPLMLMDFYSHQNPEFDFYLEQRDLMVGNYYPLDFGSFDKDKILAMQYSTEDALSGTALVYKRLNVKDKEYTVKFNGLVPGASYDVYDYDNPEKIYTKTGKDLMNEGLTLCLPEGEKCIILMYNAK